MTTLNKSARDAMVKYNVHACTDVTGFAMLGHLLEMAQGSDKQITLHVDAIDMIPEAMELAKMGILPEGMYRNRSFAEAWVDMGDTPLYKQDILFDPQTAGGLLMAVDPADADALFNELKGLASPAPSGSAWWRTTRAAPGSSCADRPGDTKITRYCREKPAPPGRLFPFPRQNQADRAICPGTAFSQANIGQNFLSTFFTRFSGLSGPFGGKPEIWGCQFFPLLPICYQRHGGGKRWELWLFAAGGGVKTGRLLPNARFFCYQPLPARARNPLDTRAYRPRDFSGKWLGAGLKGYKSGHNKSISGTFASKKLEGGNDPP